MRQTSTSILDQMLCFEVYSTEHAFSRLYKNLLASTGLTYPQFLVMVLLWEKDDRTVNEIGGQLGLESSTLTPLLKRLEANGVLARKRDAQDERRVRVSLTEAGAAMREEARGIGACVADATGMPETELRALLLDLRRLRSGLEDATQKLRAAE